LNPAVWLRVERFLGARLMEQHFVVVLTRHEAGGWRAHSPDFPRCHAEGQTAETAVADAARKIRSFIFALRANGKPVPPLRSYAEVRIDDCAGSNLQASRNLEDRPEGAAFSRNTVVGRDDTMQDALLVSDEEVLKVDSGAGDDRRRLI